MNAGRVVAISLLAVAAACAPQATPHGAVHVSELRPDLILARPLLPGGDWLLWGRFETTRSEYLEDADVVDGDRPVSMISALEASEWCEARGLRLPSEAEWRAMPMEGAARAFDTVPPQDRNGLELNLGHALPVGVFERGRTGLGLYDVYGNVREMCWLEDGRVRAYGGSYAAREANRDPRQQLDMEPASRAEDVGFRVVANATTYFSTVLSPAWAAMNEEEKASLRMNWQSWREEYRLAFVRHLAQQAEVDPALLAALTQSSSD